MKFEDLLNQYLEQLQCTAKELAEATGLAPASLSRYRTGERIPGSEQMERLIAGIVLLAQHKGLPGMEQADVRAAFSAYIEPGAIDYERFTANLNTLLSVLDISVSELSRAMSFDASYLSRIRLGQRRPSEPERFITGVCRYAIRKKSRSAIAGLLGCPAQELAAESACFSALYQWLSSGAPETADYMGNFLEKLDCFDLDEYIRAIHFDELKVPTAPFQLPASRTYAGLEEMKQGELDFFKATVLSRSREPVFMCSDMPMEDMGQDLDFGKKWMFAIAMTLKKGLHLNIIHNLDRPFKEMMLGLESWIPLYMTGQVSPYYLKGRHNGVYCHFNYVSGQAALTGECIQGYHADGRYYLTNSKEEVAYYRKKAAHLLSKAQPLMEIYRRENEAGYHAFLEADAKTEGARHSILSVPPLCTLPEQTLRQILRRHRVPDADSERLLAFAETQRRLAKIILEHSPVLEEIALLTQEEFEKHPVALPLAGAFYEQELLYTYDEYLQHLNATEQFARAVPNYRFKTNAELAFRNLQIQIHEGQWVMVSKNKAPTIHFVIRHSKMLYAFENFVVPVTERAEPNEPL